MAHVVAVTSGESSNAGITMMIKGRRRDKDRHDLLRPSFIVHILNTKGD